LFRDVFDEVGFVPVRVRRIRLIVGTCLARSGLCLDVFDEIFLSGRVLRGLDLSGRVRRGRFIVGTCSARSA